VHRRLALACTLVGTFVTPIAHADYGDHTHVPVIDEVTPSIDGVDVEIRAEPAPTLVVRNRTDRPVEVLDDDDQPFLRIGPDHVEADVDDPDFYGSESPASGAATPPSATDENPRFVTLVDGADWAWFEHRITYWPKDQPWRIPIRVGDTTAEIVGRWVPVEVPGRVVATLDPLEDDIAGLYLAVLDGPAPGLFVGNDTGEAFVVDDQRGDPFLRIGPEITTRARPGGDHETVAPTARYGWIEPRLGWQGDPPDEHASRRWEVPARLGDDDLVLSGTVEWVPLDRAGADGKGGGVPRALVIGGIVAVAVLAAGVVLATAGKRDKGV